MAFINSHQHLTVNSELDLFSVPPTQESVESGHYLSYRPISSISTHAPIEFSVLNNGEEYIDLAHIHLYLKVKLTKIEKVSATNVRSLDNVGPINNFMHSLFSQVDVSLNQRCVTPPSNNYNYRAYISNLLNYGEDAKKSHLTSSLWFKDTAGRMEASDVNEGYESRKKYSNSNRVFDMISPLHIDLKSASKYLLNGVEMTIKLIQAKPEFFLMSTVADPTCKFEIQEAELFVRKLKINSSVLIAHAKALAVGTAKYNITRVDVKTVTIPTGIQNKTIDGIYTGQLPKRCIIGFVSNKAFNGTYDSNPYNFKNYNLSFLSLYVDSVQIPSKPFVPDFANKLYIREYDSLFQGSGVFYKDIGNDISREDYPNGYFLTGFDLTSTLSSHENFWSVEKNGSLRIELRFAAALEETVTVIVFSEFDNLIEIDKNRNIILDYSS
jgi:hypothetical protein